jgi:CHAT domain-containing protein
MSVSGSDDTTIRDYLLGRLTPEDREEFARRFFTDEELFEQLQAGEEDLIDDFLSGNLSQDEVDLFHRNFLDGSKRKRALRIGKAWRNYAATHAREKLPKPATVPAWWFKIAATSAIVLIAAVGVWRISLPSDVDKGLKALDAAFQEERPIESRITGLPYAQFLATRGNGPGNVNESELRLAEATLLEAVAKKPTPVGQHALGKVHLAKKEFDEAIAEFEKALKGDPTNAQIYADLGAAMFEKGKLEIERARSDSDSAESGKGMDYFARSLENLNKALKDHDLREALFNRALLHESMGLLPQAEEDWRKYLERDPNSKWADDARKGLARIEAKRKTTSETREEILQRFLHDFDSGDEAGLWTTVSSYQNRTGNVVAEQLIDAYLDAAARDKKEDADHAMQRLSRLGDLQVRNSTDRFFFDLALFYKSATSEQRESVLKAREMMKEAYKGWGKLGPEENRKFFTKAQELFEDARDYPEARVADYWISFCHYREDNLKNNNESEQKQNDEDDQKQSRQILNSLISACEKQHYLALDARARYLLSSIEFDANEQSKALDASLRAAQLATSTNDSVGLLNAESALIEYYRYLHDYPKALGCIQRSLPLVTSTALDPIQGVRHYNLAASAFATIGLLDAALSYQREAVRIASNTVNATLKSQNYAFLGAIQGKLKDFDEALKNVQLAFDLAQAENSYRMMGYSALQMGNIYRDAEDCDKAVVQYNRSINIYNEFKSLKPRLYEAHKGRFFCYLRQQNDQLAQAEISVLFNLLDKYHSQISDESYRNTFFDVEQTVVDAAIDFEYSRMNNADQAFNYSNSSRARSLLDLLNADKDEMAKVREPDIKFQSVSEAPSLAIIKDQLPDETQVVQYVVLENKLLIWVISRNDAQVKMHPISRKELNEKLLRYLNIISHPPKADELQEESLLAKELYAILIQPVETLLDKRKQLCIIPDGNLNYLPFAALVTPESGKYFFEDHRLMTSQSASVFLSCSENALLKNGPREEIVLSVGNPTFDRDAFPDLKYLPDATTEAVEVSKLYKSNGPLTEERVTKAAVNSGFEKSDVIHLALHSKIDDEVPLRSKLLLAATSKTRAEDSFISALELYNLDLAHTRLVVLSSCQSGVGRYYGGEGVSSLARAFISAGVPLVVASLWPVESTATEKLMVSFHRHRRQEHNTVEALRSAQRDMLHGSTDLSRPYYWAAFTVTGGYAEF